MRETVVLEAIDKLRRDLSGYHGQLVAYNELERHCDNQRKRISELEGLLAERKAENAKLRELLQDVAICASGNYCYDCPHQHDGCDRDERLRAEGIEVGA